MKEGELIVSLIKSIRDKIEVLETDVSVALAEHKQISNMLEFEVKKLRAENESLRERVETQAALIRKKGY